MVPLQTNSSGDIMMYNDERLVPPADTREEIGRWYLPVGLSHNVTYLIRMPFCEKSNVHIHVPQKRLKEVMSDCRLYHLSSLMSLTIIRIYGERIQLCTIPVLPTHQHVTDSVDAIRGRGSLLVAVVELLCAVNFQQRGRPISMIINTKL